MEAAAGSSNLSGDQRQRNQATGIVGAVDMLGNPHAPENNRGFRSCVGARNNAQNVRINTADFGHSFGGEVRNVLFELSESFSLRFDILFIV